MHSLISGPVLAVCVTGLRLVGSGCCHAIKRHQVPWLWLGHGSWDSCQGTALQWCLLLVLTQLMTALTVEPVWGCQPLCAAEPLNQLLEPQHLFGCF